MIEMSKSAELRKVKSALKKKPEPVDPAVLLQQKFRNKCRFRAIVRLALANAYWLYEESEEYEGVDDVKKRVAQAMRAKKKHLLSLGDKALLNKPAKDRTDQEKSYLYRIIGGLKCFKRYPNNVKRKLAAVTYFKYYGPGRVIVREHHDAVAMYFIVTGDVVVTHMEFDELLNKEVAVELGVMHTGDLFGEVSLLHNIPRTATCVTMTHCELLALMKEDFKNVLQATIQVLWDEMRNAMSYFSYFDSLDEVARREGCIMARMKIYRPNETILGDGEGIPNFVYFVLVGQCQMIETLKVSTTVHTGRKYYTLYDPHESKDESEDKDFEKYFRNLNRSITSESVMKTETSSLLRVGHAESTAKQAKVESRQISSRPASRQSNIAGGSKLYRSASQLKRGTSIKLPDDEFEIHPEPSVQLRILLPPPEPCQRDSMRFSNTKIGFHEPVKLQTYFMQVCLFNAGSSFGLGENMRDRRIVAVTAVQCMLMPKVWLLQRNTANIWSRIQHFLEKRIPNKKELFKAFVAERRWDEYRDSLVEDIVARSHTVNWTTVHDVPYCIRMQEMFGI